MNNPIMNIDPSGHFSIVALLVGIGVGVLAGALAGGGIALYCDYKDNQTFDFSIGVEVYIALPLLLSGIGGLLAAALITNNLYVWVFLMGAAAGFATSAYDQKPGEVDMTEIVINTVTSGMIGLFSVMNPSTISIILKMISSGMGSYLNQINDRYSNGDALLKGMISAFVTGAFSYGSMTYLPSSSNEQTKVLMVAFVKILTWILGKTTE